MPNHIKNIITLKGDEQKIREMLEAIQYDELGLGTSYFEYRKHGQFEFTAPAILFACLIFTLTAPLYIWSIL